MSRSKYEVVELTNEELKNLLEKYETEKDSHSLKIFPIGITYGKNRILLKYIEKH